MRLAVGEVVCDLFGRPEPVGADPALQPLDSFFACLDRGGVEADLEEPDRDTGGLGDRQELAAVDRPVPSFRATHRLSAELEPLCKLLLSEPCVGLGRFDALLQGGHRDQ